MVTTGMFTSNTDEWYTPLDFFNQLDTEFNFNLDPCATDENHKCDRYFTKQDDGLTKNWGGAACFAIHLTDGLSVNGLKRHIMNHLNQIL